MIEGLKGYETFKDSGLPWVGQIPAHWRVQRGKALFAECALPVADDDEIVTCFRDGQVTLRKNRRTSGFMIALKEAGYQGVRKGQLVIHAMDAFAGAIGVSESNGKCTPEYIVCRPRSEQTIPGYFAALLRKAAHTGFIQVTCAAVRERAPRLRYPNFGDMRFPVPPPEEQVTILRFLDHADRRIRRIIRVKRKLITLLKEQKQVIIYQSITRGQNQKARFKPSGVEWLGEIPEHWEVKKLKCLTRFHNGIAFKPSDWSESGVPIIRIQNLNGSSCFNYTVRKDLPESLLIQPGDLLFSWSGNLGTSFGSFIWDRDFSGYLNQHIFKLDGYSLDRRYFAHLLRAVTMHVEEQTHGIIGLVHITKPELGAVLVPLAPINEQIIIAKMIDDKLTEIDAIINKANREIQLLLELRTRLISDVVTGKLDVREAAAQFPSEEDTAEIIDDAEDLTEDEEAPEDVEPEEVEA